MAGTTTENQRSPGGQGSTEKPPIAPGMMTAGATAGAAVTEGDVPSSSQTSPDNSVETKEGETTRRGSEAATTESEVRRSKTETFVILVSLATPLFLAALDSTIITTAVPTITAHFQSSSGYVWIGSAYLLGNAAFIPAWGELSGIFGRKPVLLLAVTVFLIGSLLCGVSRSMGMLIATRALQGIGSGGAIVLPNLCISDLFSLRKRGLYFGLLGITWAVASAVGPVMGGVFTDQLSWRWCFYINLPIGGLALVALIFFLKLHNPRTPIRQGLAAMDWVGNFLIIGATLLILLAVELGGIEYPWHSATVICLFVFGAAMVALFITCEARLAKFPVIPLHLFRQTTNAASFSLSMLHAITFMGGSYWLPLYFQSVLAATPLMSGVYLLPFVLSLSFVSSLAGLAIKKTGNYRLPISGGFFISILGYGLFTWLGDRPHWERVILFQIIAGIGVGPNFQAPLIALQSNVEQRHIGAATASFAFLRQIGNSISVTIGGALFNNVMQDQNKKLAATVGPDLAIQFQGDSAAAAADTVRTLDVADRQTVQSAYWKALQTMFIMYTCFCAVAFLVSLFIKHKVLTKHHTEFKTGLKSLNRRT